MKKKTGGPAFPIPLHDGHEWINDEGDSPDGMQLRDYLAAKAMEVVMGESQEMRTASFWDWLKMLMVMYLHFTFLHVKTVRIEGVYEEAAKRAYDYSDAMIAERDRE